MKQSRAIRSSLKPPLGKSYAGPWRARQGPCCFRSQPLLILALLLSFSLFTFHHADAQPEDLHGYLDQLIQDARVNRLAAEREWHLLLHYRPRLFGGFESEQDDPGFFLSPEGKTDPSAELTATLKQFFSEELVGRSKQPAQCAFVARYHWLKEKLAFDDSRLKPITCERFERWFVDFDADAVTVVYPAGYMNNPSSTFGHTFLRIDQRGQTEQTRILAYTINYAAELPPDVGPEYAIKGVFGGYKGYFSTIPYYLKVQEYRDLENRDIWEYRLRLSPDQLRRLLMHAWELGNAYFDYFFFKENCSYHILSLLEVAEPSLHLTDQSYFVTIPTDTIRQLMAYPGLVGDVVYRPSRATLVRRKRERLSVNEVQVLNRLVSDGSVAKTEPFAGYPPARQALLLDIASDYLLVKSAGDSESAKIAKSLNREILTVRSRIKLPPERIPIQPWTERPDVGHGTSRVGVGIGWRNDQPFEEWAIRAAYHDLLDPEKGYTPDAQIEALSLAVRKYSPTTWNESSFSKSVSDTQIRIERFTLLNMISLSPMDSLFHAPSWKFGIGMNTIRFNGCRLCSNGYFSGGLGGAIESHWLKRELFFAFAEAEANYSKAYDEDHRIGGGGTVGMLSDVTERWKVLLSGSYLRYALGDKSDDFRWTVGQRLTLLQNLALRLDYNHRDHDNDVMLSMLVYF